MQRSPRSTPEFDRSTLAYLLVAAAGLACAPFACSASPNPSENSSHGSGQGGSNLTVGGGPCEKQCSADLRQILDCNGNVVETCPDNQGCDPGGTCVDPCGSAQTNGSTTGCEFYSLVPPSDEYSLGSCHAMLLANTWPTPVTVQAEYGGQQLDIGGLARVPVGSGQSLVYQPLANGQIGPGQLAILFLAQANGAPFLVPCPAGVSAGIKVDTSIPTTGFGEAFRVTTSAPVVAYDIYPYGGALSAVTSATLLVPTTAWGTNYIAADGYEHDPSLGNFGSPFVQIVASQDDTKVTISPTVFLEGGSMIPPVSQGQPATYNLNRGQMLQFMQNSEIAGSPISSDKPIGVWGGSACMSIPVGVYSCDTAHQQLPPVKALGNEYAAVRYRDREPGANESVPWTIIGAVDGTTLTYDPAPPPGAPASLESGQMVRFFSATPFVVRSQDEQHPFSFAGHMTGWGNLPSGADTGDPEYVIVVPPRQYLSRYLFLTDPTYGNTHLVFVRQKAKDGTFKPVKLDCKGTLDDWKPLGGSAQYEYTRVDLLVQGVLVDGCNNGVHTAESEEPFGLTVWGWDAGVSYAFPAGMGTRPINTVEVPPVPK